MSWTKKGSVERIQKAIDDIKSVDVVDLVREADLSNIPLDKAYRVNGVHVYVDIPNAVSLLGSAQQESEASHRRFLRFLHVYQRVAQQVFNATEAMKVDFQNHRLHFVVHKPYDDESKRIACAVAIADLLRQTIATANELHQELPDAKVCVGIESGQSLAVNNGTRGDREPLFIGNPANLAAKLLGKTAGVYLGQGARGVLGKDWSCADPSTTALTAEQLEKCAKMAALSVDAKKIAKAWAKELAESPLAEFSFQHPTPPLKNLDLDELSPANSRRLDSAVLVADVDGFTRFVADAMAGDQAPAAVRAMHVIRKELRDVLNDFGGRKIRYVGDAIIGICAEGTAHDTDGPLTVTSTLLCAAAMRDAFGVIQEKLPQTATLGLTIGFETGPIAVTRLGLKGSRDRCLIGRAALGAQKAQESGKARDTVIGERALAAASPAVKQIFATSKIQPDLGYNKVFSALESENDETLKKLKVTPAGPEIIVPRAHADGTGQVAGAAGGALLGLAVAGPPGALIGGFIGWLVGKAADEED